MWIDSWANLEQKRIHDFIIPSCLTLFLVMRTVPRMKQLPKQWRNMEWTLHHVLDFYFMCLTPVRVFYFLLKNVFNMSWNFIHGSFLHLLRYLRDYLNPVEKSLYNPLYTDTDPFLNGDGACLVCMVRAYPRQFLEDRFTLAQERRHQFNPSIFWWQKRSWHGIKF